MLHGIASRVVLRECHRNGDVYNVYIYIIYITYSINDFNGNVMYKMDGCSIAMFDYRRTFSS